MFIFFIFFNSFFLLYFYQFMMQFLLYLFYCIYLIYFILFTCDFLMLKVRMEFHFNLFNQCMTLFCQLLMRIFFFTFFNLMNFFMCWAFHRFGFGNFFVLIDNNMFGLKNIFLVVIFFNFMSYIFLHDFHVSMLLLLLFSYCLNRSQNIFLNMFD